MSSAVSCSNPIDPAVLADYWLAELAPAEELSMEEHLFACEDCSRTLQSLIDLAEGIRILARQGNLGMILTREFLDRLASEGLRVREYAPKAGGAVECTVTVQDDFLIGRLGGGSHGYRKGRSGALRSLRSGTASVSGYSLSRRSHRGHPELPDRSGPPVGSGCARNQALRDRRARRADVGGVHISSYAQSDLTMVNDYGQIELWKRSLSPSSKPLACRSCSGSRKPASQS